jgi:hypothetical protein
VAVLLADAIDDQGRALTWPWDPTPGGVIILALSRSRYARATNVKAANDSANLFGGPDRF